MRDCHADYYTSYIKASQMNKDFELIPHTADLKLRVYGTTCEQLFRNAVVGMFQVMMPQAPGCDYRDDRLVCPQLPITHHIELRASDLELLLVDFLSEVLYLADSNNEAYLDAAVTIHKTTLQATVHGVSIAGFGKSEIKAVTYHDLSIKKVGDGWQAELVFDI